MYGVIKKNSQCAKIFQVLKENGGWINGRYFLEEMDLKQYKDRIFELQQNGYRIKISDEDSSNFKSYRLLKGYEKV